ncbi:MAG: hypothetical protein M1834_004748 [Cirrosporium novae-zelandiae]|nr:MAG: hypothetical protein M1834_004748 [Cirrosporium novae-zelandiae]
MAAAPNTLHYTLIDAMTSTPFTGNPTPVFILDDGENTCENWLGSDVMQKLAGEMNHSETAFVRRRQRAGGDDDGNVVYDIRWYTPTAEEPFCGHGILAATIALHERYGEKKNYRFETVKGALVDAHVVSSSSSSSPNPTTTYTIQMTFPSFPITTPLSSPSTKTKFATALNIKPSAIVAIGKNELQDLIIELDKGVDFSDGRMRIDAGKLLEASPKEVRSQVVTRAVTGKGFEKRVFAYGSEDQATGSTYCALGPYWGDRLGRREALRAVQVSRRGGGAEVECYGVGGDGGGEVIGVKADGVVVGFGDIVLPVGEGERKLLAKL